MGLTIVEDLIQAIETGSDPRCSATMVGPPSKWLLRYASRTATALFGWTCR